MTRLLLFTACLIVALTSVAEARVHAFYWDSSTGMVDLGTLGGDSIANGINDSGQIVGYSYLTDQGPIHMVMWTTTGGIVDLGSIDNSAYSEAKAINSVGDIVGSGYDANLKQVAFFWSSSTGYVSLGEVPNGYANGNDINDSDTIAGSAYGPGQGFVWLPLQLRRKYIGTLPGGATSEAFGINNLSHITGAAALPSGALDAFVWTKSGGMRDIGTVQEGVSTIGLAINDKDEVVGFTVFGTERPFYWRDVSGIRLLHTLGGTNAEAYAINDSGAIVGSCQIPTNLFHATLWSSHNATPQDLGTLPGGSTSVAKAINASGQVVGWADVP